MRCSSFCISKAINLHAFTRHLKQNGARYSLYPDVVEFHYSPEHLVYYFANGTVVTWGLLRSATAEVIANVKPFCNQLHNKIERDDFSYKITGKTDFRPHDYFNVDIITLSDESEELRLAMSTGISQSVKLQSDERHISALIDEHSHLIKDLARRGKIKLRQKEISQIIGRIFLAKSRVNLEGEYLRPPQYFWSHPAYEAEYSLIERYLNIPKRVASLNQKLDTLSEMFDMFTGQLQHQHSSYLEIIIIALIAVEVVFSLLTFI